MRIKSTYWKFLIVIHSLVADYAWKDNIARTVFELPNYKNASKVQKLLD